MRRILSFILPMGSLAYVTCAGKAESSNINRKPERLKSTLRVIKEREKLIAGVTIQEPALRFMA